MKYRSLLATLLLVLCFATLVSAEEPSAVLFNDVRIFDGVDATLLRANLLVEGDTIAKISAQPIDAPAGAVVVEGNGRILSPGFIDLHAHLTFQAPKDEMGLHPWAVGAIAGRIQERRPAGCCKGRRRD